MTELMKNTLELEIPDEEAMLNLGQKIAKALPKTEACTIFLHGELGAGKTTLARSILRGLGVTGRVKSPTYTLVEPYELGDRMIYHLDLYRLTDPEELEFLGIRDYLSDNAILLVEWPERGEGMLPGANADIRISYAGPGRRVAIEPGAHGRYQWIQALNG